MAAAAGKKSTTSLSLFMEAFGLEVERGALYYSHSDLGRSSLGGQMGVQNKKKYG